MQHGDNSIHCTMYLKVAKRVIVNVLTTKKIVIMRHDKSVSECYGGDYLAIKLGGGRRRCYTSCRAILLWPHTCTVTIRKS